jgi:hypothetical protein
MGGPGPSEALADARYLSVTTFRRDGTPVTTPVWFLLADGQVWARSAADSGKVRRIRRRGEVRLAPCTRDGTETGPAVPARAEVLPRSADRRAYRALLRRYGPAARAYDLYWTRLRGTRTVLLRFRLDGS